MYSTNFILSRSPDILSKSPGFLEKSFKLFKIAGYNILFIKVLFPEPETPVTVTNLFNGIVTLIFLRLFSLIPSILIKFLEFLFLNGIEIFNSLLRYLAVKVLLFNKSLNFP